MIAEKRKLSFFPLQYPVNTVYQSCRIRQFCDADTQKYCVLSRSGTTPMRASIRNPIDTFYTVRPVTYGNRRKRLRGRHGTSNFGISGPLRVSTTQNKHERNL